MGNVLPTTQYNQGEATFSWTASSNSENAYFTIALQYPKPGSFPPEYGTLVSFLCGGAQHDIVANLYNGSGDLLSSSTLNTDFAVPSTPTEFIIDICNSTCIIATASDKVILATFTSDAVNQCSYMSATASEVNWTNGDFTETSNQTSCGGSGYNQPSGSTSSGSGGSHGSGGSGGSNSSGAANSSAGLIIIIVVVVAVIVLIAAGIGGFFWLRHIRAKDALADAAATTNLE